MNTALLQLKVDPALKSDLQEVAEYKGIPVSALAKMLLKEMLRREKRQILTENGMTEERELEILRREQEALKGKNIIGPFKNAKEAVRYLRKRR